MTDALDGFAPATREWFTDAFAEPTPAQAGAWDGLRGNQHLLVVAPTGSGKTLAAFLSSIDTLMSTPRPEEPGTRVLYISPLKALAIDIERNLRSPLVGITQAAARRGEKLTPVTVGVRSGDTPQRERRALITKPPDILITTPESLYLMLTSAARETLRTVYTVIVDEVHAVAGTKRGAHLALSLERLDELATKPARRIGLSATVRPHEEVARFLAGQAPVRIVAPASDKRLELRVVVPVEDMTQLPPVEAAGTSAARSMDDSPQGSIWPHVEQAILDEVLARRSTIVFANSRGLAEKLTARLNELYGALDTHAAADATESVRSPAQMSGASGQSAGGTTLLARAHHGSVSKEQRAVIEDDLKAGRLRCVVATSSLELGIDMGAVDLVIQVSAPPSVASGLQRIGRAGHQVGEVSRGVIFPKTRQDLIGSAVAAERMLDGLIEQLDVPRNPLDILAQQTVAAAALEPLDVERWFETVRRSAPFASLPRSAYEATLDLLAGRYPSDEFAELRPRVVWDRDAGTITGRRGAQRLAVTSGGTIPDRGMFTVTLPADAETQGSRRVGELDEEMVYESRINDVIALGATSWRVQEITHDRVVVTPAYGEPGRLPFWKGDAIGRPAELGEALGRFQREMAGAKIDDARQRGSAAGLDDRAITNLLAFLSEQRAATGHIPSDRTLVFERFRDELGDWRIVLHSPYGRRVHAPWALAVAARVKERFGIDGSVVASDDGIVARIPDTEAAAPAADLFTFAADELEHIVTEEVGGSALFASRFRECSARALLLPRRNPGRRAPLWQQRQRSAQLLDVARKYPTFPILLETARECLQDVYDLPALSALTGRLASREITIVEVETERASPFAQTMLFGYVAAFLYEGDSPLAERRAAALALDPTLLAELLGRAELRELLDPSVIDHTEVELQRLDEDMLARDGEDVADLLRLLGPLTTTEIAQRSKEPAEVEQWLKALGSAKRALELNIGGQVRWCAIEDAARMRDALGTPIPAGVPDVFLEGVADPVGDLVARFARTHGPFAATEPAARFGLGVAVVTDVLRRLAGDRRLVEGEFRPLATGTEWVDSEVLRRLRSRSLAALRSQVEPVEPAAFARFLPSWQQVGANLQGVDGGAAVVEQLAGVPLPASAWESLVLPARVRDYEPSMLDELTASGEVVWSGAGALSGNDGWVRLAPAEFAVGATPYETSALEDQVLAALGGGGGFFFRQLADAAGSTDDAALGEALWGLVWGGRVSNDTLAPLRTLIRSRSAHRTAAPPPRARLHRGLGRSGIGRPGLGRAPSVSRSGPPTVSGRWWALPVHATDPTALALGTAESLLDRYGVVTRGSVQAESIPGGFAAVYRVLREMEQSGRSLRGYFIETLGAAQFTTSATVDRLRVHGRKPGEEPPTCAAIVLAATDPANPYGAALPWPERPSTQRPSTQQDSSQRASKEAEPSPDEAKSQAGERGRGHRPGRKAGAIVVLHDGHLVLYLERGGKSALTFRAGDEALTAASVALVSSVRAGHIARLSIERIDRQLAQSTAAGQALLVAGFEPTHKAIRLHA